MVFIRTGHNPRITKVTTSVKGRFSYELGDTGMRGEYV